MNVTRVQRLEITGYKAFFNFTAELAPLEVIAGANGVGKTSLFEFLRFLREASKYTIPPEIIPGPPGQMIFHKSEVRPLEWTVDIADWKRTSFRYKGRIDGRIGAPQFNYESIEDENDQYVIRLDNKVIVTEPEPSYNSFEYELGLRDSFLTKTLSKRSYAVGVFQQHIGGWRFYSS